MRNVLGSKRLWLAVALLAGPVFGVFYWGLADGDAQHDLAYSLIVVAAFLVLALLMTEWVGRTSSTPERRRYGYLEVLIGKDGYASTSKTTVWLWTLVFASALLLLSAMTWFSDLSADEAFGSDWDPYLLLLGGPFAAAVLAKGITTSRAGTATGTMNASQAASPAAAATTAPNNDEPSVTDLGKSNAGDSSLPDTQYALFSLVAVAYFIGALIDTLTSYANNACPTGSAPSETCVASITLPEIPPALLGLTSLAALTYVGAKAVETQGLRLITIVPNPVTVDQPVEISLANATETATKTTISTKFTGTDTTEERPPSDDPTRTGPITSFHVAAPSKAGTYQVVVTTPDGATTPANLGVTPRRISIVAADGTSEEFEDTLEAVQRGDPDALKNADQRALTTLVSSESLDDLSEADIDDARTRLDQLVEEIAHGRFHVDGNLVIWTSTDLSPETRNKIKPQIGDIVTAFNLHPKTATWRSVQFAAPGVTEQVRLYITLERSAPT